MLLYERFWVTAKNCLAARTARQATQPMAHSFWVFRMIRLTTMNTSQSGGNKPTS